MNGQPPRILVDENIPESEHYFGRLGRVERFAGRHLSAAQVADASALIVRSVTRVDAALLDGSQVNFVGTCTIGMDHLDQGWLAQQAIAYTNAPGCNANSVVEYVITALAALDVNWQGLRIGIVGCGNVGGGLYRRLSALGAQVVGYDPLIDSQALPALVDLAEVFASDVVCVHAPLTHGGSHPSHHMITAELLAMLPDGAVFLNAGRGPVVANDTLLAFHAQRPDVRLVLDVWEFEPWLDARLLAACRIGTPHIAGYSYDGKVAGTQMVYEALCRHWQRPWSPDQAKTPTPDGASASPLLPAEDWQQVRRVLLAAYDLMGDDQRLRTMVASATNRTALEQGFDQLRKHYPERREFRFCAPVTQFAATPLSPAAMAALSALGLPL